MRIAIATPTGTIGRKLVNVLLAQGRPELILLARNPEKLVDARRRGAMVIQGDLFDEDYVRRATAGVDVLFWVAPSQIGSEDPCRDVRNLAENAATAIDDNAIGRLVHLSSVGAHRGDRLGPIGGLREGEIILDQTDAEITHLRAGFFMENYLWMIDGINEEGAVFMPVSGSVRVPMICTADIALEAARMLTDTTWGGRREIEVIGPTDVSFDEAAACIGEAIGRDIRHTPISPQEARAWMLSMGYSGHGARLMLELFAGIDNGLYGLRRPRSEAVVTATTFGQFARGVMTPAIHARKPVVPT